MERYRTTFCQGSPLEMAKIMHRPWRGTSHWIRSLCTSTAKVPLRQSAVQSTKPWEPKAPVHTFGTSFWFPTTRSRRSRSRVMRQSAMWRRGEPPTYARRETSLLFVSPRQSLRVLLGQASGTLGGQGPRFAQVQGLERYQGMAVGMDVDVAAGVESRKYAPMSSGSARSAALETGGVVQIADTVRVSGATTWISRSRQLRKNCRIGEDAGWYGRRRDYFS